MKLSTKTLASLLFVTALAAAAPGTSEKLRGRRGGRGSQFDRLLQHHDRKGELRAAVLGIDATTFRTLHKRHTLEEIAKQHGFKNARGFRIALFGKLKNELLSRGWSLKRIERHMMRRRARLG